MLVCEEGGKIPEFCTVRMLLRFTEKVEGVKQRQVTGETEGR